MEGDCFFGFFNNDGYFLETPDGFHYRGIPHVLQHTVNKDASKGLWLTTGIGNSYSYRYIAKNGGTYAAWRNCPTGLQAELDVPKPKAKVLKASLGPDRDDFFLFRRDGSSAWAASTPVVQWMREQKRKLGSPRLVVFGAEDSAVAVFSDGVISRNVPEDLYRVLVETDVPIRFITLSPYDHDHYFVQFEDHSIAYSVPAATFEDIRVPLETASKVYVHATFRRNSVDNESYQEVKQRLSMIQDEPEEEQEEGGGYIHVAQQAGDGPLPSRAPTVSRPEDGYFDLPQRPKVSRHSTRDSRLGTQYFSPPPEGPEGFDNRLLAPSGSPLAPPLLSRNSSDRRSSNLFSSRPTNDRRSSSQGWESAAKTARAADKEAKMVTDKTKNPWLRRTTSLNKKAS